MIYKIYKSYKSYTNYYFISSVSVSPGIAARSRHSLFYASIADKFCLDFLYYCNQHCINLSNLCKHYIRHRFIAALAALCRK